MAGNFLKKQKPKINQAALKAEVQKLTNQIKLNRYQFEDYLHIQDQKSSGDGGGATAGSWFIRDLNTLLSDGIGEAFQVFELPYDGGTGAAPEVGEVLTGGTSGATAEVWDVNGGVAASGTVLVVLVTGTFVDNEALTGSVGLVALVNNAAAEDAATGLDYDHGIVLPAGEYRVHAVAPGYRTDGMLAKLYSVTDAADIVIGPNAQSPSGLNSPDVLCFVRGMINLDVATHIRLMQRVETTRATDGRGRSVPFASPQVYSELEVWRIRRTSA